MHYQQGFVKFFRCESPIPPKALDIQLKTLYNIGVESDIMISFSKHFNLTPLYFLPTKCPRGSNCQRLTTSLNERGYPR